MKLAYRCVCHSIDCSVIILSVAIWSMYDLFFRKPACSSHSFSSSAPFSLSNSMCVKTLLGTDRSVKLSYLSLAVLQGIHFFYSVGTFSCSQIFRNRWCNISIFVIGSAFRASVGMPSGPGVFYSLWLYVVWSWHLSEPLVVCRLVLASFIASGGMLSGPGIFHSLFWYAVWSWRLS